MNKIRISAVSYTNTKPFILGLENAKWINKVELTKDIPSECALKLIENRADIGLILVAAIPFLPNARIISDYCIGSEGAVDSVFIFSEVPVDKIKTVKLDAQSRTSNNLAKVLLKFYWKNDVTFLESTAKKADAIVLIGDRTFGKKESYPYAYDLGKEWLDFTGLPFVYAAWVANKPLPATFVTAFNVALKYGLDHRSEVIAALPPIENFDFEDYLMEKLDFEFKPDKKEALQLFLSYISIL